MMMINFIYKRIHLLRWCLIFVFNTSINLILNLSELSICDSVRLVFFFIVFDFMQVLLENVIKQY